MRTSVPSLVAAALLVAAGPAKAQCPKIVIQVDNDLPGSGYSEVKPKNWIAHPVSACHKNYRYLSHTVGDGTRKGQAIWQPKITVAGWYEVQTSYRATGNRTTDADYYLFDDAGGKAHVTVNQQLGSGCTKKVLGSVYCKVGGSCRLLLDGDDGASDAADITTFTLTKCSGPPPKNPCTGISQNPAYELCSWTASTCSGLYTNGAGCTAYCKAAGMVCVARYGASPGCQKEPQNPIPCGAQNSNKSDWCECALPAKPDAGAPKPDAAPPKPDAAPPVPPDAFAPGADRALPGADQGSAGDLGSPWPALPDVGSAPASPGGVSGGCSALPRPGCPADPLLLGLLLLLVTRYRPLSWGRVPAPSPGKARASAKR